MTRASLSQGAHPVSLELARQVLFGPILQETAVDAVARRIRSAIRLGVLAPGDRLPAETELARQLDVGVMTLRAALADLRDEELLETRRGRTGGSFIRASEPGSPRVSTTLEEVRSLLEVRVVVEAGAAWHAAQRATAAEVFALEVLAEWVNDPARADKIWLVDAQFHMSIAEITRNERLVEVVADMKTRSAEVLIAAGLAEWRPAAHWGDHHRRIVDAIGRGDAQGASDAMREHLETVLAFVEEQIAARKAGDAAD